MKKKVLATLLSLTLALALTACGGGVDKQPAIDAHNKAVDAVNEISALINENPSLFTQEEIDQFNSCIDTMDETAAALETQDLTKEQVVEYVKACEETIAWATDTAEAIRAEQ